MTRQARMGGPPDCDLREATRAGDVQFGASDSFKASGDVPVTRCYEGALVRYTDAGRTVTVVGTRGLHDQLRSAETGQRRPRDEPRGHPTAGRSGTRRSTPRVESSGSSGHFRSHSRPGEVDRHAAVPGGRCCLRCGRADESVPLSPSNFRSWCAPRRPSRAADGSTGPIAHGTAPPRRCARRPCSGYCPGWASGLPPSRLPSSQTVAQRSGADPEALRHALFGPPPAADTDLVNLAHALDDIERQVAQS